MPKITSVEPQKSSYAKASKRRGRQRFNIFIDGRFAFGADEDLVVDRRLVVGKELSISDLEQLIKEVEIGKLMARVYRVFSIRQRAEKEIRDYLKNLSFKRKLKNQPELSSFIIDTAVDTMKKKGILNDEEFARAWVESRRRKKGPRVLKQELFKKGIDREIVEEVISGQWAHTESGEGYSEKQTAEKLLEKKMRIWKNLPIMEFRKKTYEFLLRRGFEYDVVKDVVEKFLQKR